MLHLILELAVLAYIGLGCMPVDKVFDMLSDAAVLPNIVCAEKVCPVFGYTTKKYSFMDKIVNVIDKTEKIFPNDSITKNLYSCNFYMEVFEIDEAMTNKRHNYLAYKDIGNNATRSLKLTDDGSYYIEVNMSSPDIYGTFKFEYDSLHFVCDQYYAGFFKKLNDFLFCRHRDRVIYQLALSYEGDFDDYDQYTADELDDMLDEPYDYGDWRFLIIDGRVKSALYFDGYYKYDFMSQRQINYYEFYKQLPYPKSRYSTPMQWDERLKSSLKSGGNMNTYLNFRALK